MHLILHMRESLIFAYVAQSHGGRELVECGAHPLSPHVIVPHGANMRGTLICNMRCIFLIYIYVCVCVCVFVCVCICVCVCIHVCMHAFMYVRARARTHTHMKKKEFII